MRLKRLREERKITQKQLAAMLGVAPNTISQYESGKREPDIDTLMKIASILEVSVDNLLGNEEQAEARALVNGDRELTEYLDMLANRSECRMLFSLAKDATREDVEVAVRMIEALRAKERGDVDT